MPRAVVPALPSHACAGQCADRNLDFTQPAGAHFHGLYGEGKTFHQRTRDHQAHLISRLSAEDQELPRPDGIEPDGIEKDGIEKDRIETDGFEGFEE